MKGCFYALLGLALLLVACRVEQPVRYLSAKAVPEDSAHASPAQLAVAPVNPRTGEAATISYTLASNSAALRPTSARATFLKGYFSPRLRISSPAATHLATGKDLALKPKRGFIMSGIGAGFAVGSWLAASSVHTFGGAVLVGQVFWVGVALVIIGLLYYLLAQYLNSRTNQRT